MMLEGRGGPRRGMKKKEGFSPRVFRARLANEGESSYISAKSRFGAGEREDENAICLR